MASAHSLLEKNGSPEYPVAADAYVAPIALSRPRFETILRVQIVVDESVERVETIADERGAQVSVVLEERVAGRIDRRTTVHGTDRIDGLDHGRANAPCDRFEPSVDLIARRHRFAQRNGGAIDVNVEVEPARPLHPFSRIEVGAARR